MGFKYADIKMPPNFTAEELRNKIAKKLHLKDFTYTIDKQSLDARNKHHILWQVKVGVSSPSIKDNEPPPQDKLSIPYIKQNRRVVIVGSGPAGFFAGYILQQAGIQVTIIEQGPEVNVRYKDIISFERSGELNERSNYAFGEGGAGTFSDGKLTSRTKTISLEKQYIFDTYIEAGAPAEIAYLAHPHLGSDNLRKITKYLRHKFLSLGGSIFFDTKVEDLSKNSENDRIKSLETTRGKVEGEDFIFAIGHSSLDTYRMLMKRGIPFKVKSFALGFRAEHQQELINQAQWGRKFVPGLKAAEYRLTYKPETDDLLPVYSFCMCPGGKVVPATAYKDTNIVNGMSNYRRNSPYANAAVVAGIQFDHLLNRQVEPLEALDWLEELERRFFRYANGFAAPACKISHFLEGKTTQLFPGTSYPFGLVTADFNDLLPLELIKSLKMGLKDFCRKLKGYEDGILLGLESKTSSPIQAVRDDTGKSAGIENLYIAGEGSGFAGGIVSSAADGIKIAINIINT